MHTQNRPIQNSPKNHVMNKNNSPMQTVRFKFAITGSKFPIESYPLLASSQHVGATAAVSILFFMFADQRTILGLPVC